VAEEGDALSKLLATRMGLMEDPAGTTAATLGVATLGEVG
jgi:hypothetical protein